VSATGAATRRAAAILGLTIALALALSAVAQADVYWGNYLGAFAAGSSYVGHARLDGSEANAQLLDVKKEKPVAIAADDTSIYVAFPGPLGGSIGRANLQTGEANPHFIFGPGGTALSGVGPIAVTPESVYWTNDLLRPEGVGAEIGRAPISGGEAEPFFITVPSGEPANSIAVSGNHIYWSEGLAIGRANLNGTEAESEFIKSDPANKLGFIKGIAADSEHLYWTHEVTEGQLVTGAIGRMSLTGGAFEPTFIGGLSNPTALAVDAHSIYWSAEHSIGKAELNGAGANQNFIANAGDPSGVALDHRIIVNSAADFQDASPGDGTCAASKEHGSVCTLRAAIEEVNAQKKTIRATVGVEIPGAKLETLTLTKPLPKIEASVVIDARSQPGGFVAGERKIGLIIDGSTLGIEPAVDGLELGPAATNSVIAGLQVQHFSGDGVLLEGTQQQVGDSVLTKDVNGVEIAGVNDIVGITEGVAGDIFFEDGRPNLISYLKGLEGKHETGENFQKGVAAFGAGVELVKGSAGARIDGDYIGVHGEGFETAADKLAPDGLKEFNATNGFSIGVVVAPAAATGAISDVEIGAPGIGSDVISTGRGGGADQRAGDLLRLLRTGRGGQSAGTLRRPDRGARRRLDRKPESRQRRRGGHLPGHARRDDARGHRAQGAARPVEHVWRGHGQRQPGTRHRPAHRHRPDIGRPGRRHDRWRLRPRQQPPRGLHRDDAYR
jgi:CSLREA domain-containing protein